MKVFHGHGGLQSAYLKWQWNTIGLGGARFTTSQMTLIDGSDEFKNNSESCQGSLIHLLGASTNNM